jgi:hypothetical protein
VCVLGTLGRVLDVGGGGEGCVFACLPSCHVWFLRGFHYFSGACASWLRGAWRLAVGVVVFVYVVGLGVWRGIVGRVAVFLRYVWSHGVFGVGIRGFG